MWSACEGDYLEKTCRTWISSNPNLPSRDQNIIMRNVWLSKENSDEDLQSVVWSCLHIQTEMRWTSGDLQIERKSWGMIIGWMMSVTRSMPRLTRWPRWLAGEMIHSWRISDEDQVQVLRICSLCFFGDYHSRNWDEFGSWKFHSSGNCYLRDWMMSAVLYARIQGVILVPC